MAKHDTTPLTQSALPLLPPRHKRPTTGRDKPTDTAPLKSRHPEHHNNKNIKPHGQHTTHNTQQTPHTKTQDDEHGNKLNKTKKQQTTTHKHQNTKQQHINEHASTSRLARCFGKHEWWQSRFRKTVTGDGHEA
jgi:hypothetical protein